MVSRVQTVAFQGLDVITVDVQVQFSSGLVGFQIVGLPDKAVGESKERIRSTFHAMGLSLPAKRITVNLSPADLQKEGSHYDLPIALGLLLEMQLIPADALASFITLGELALDGTLTSVPGTLPTALHASTEMRGLICPYPNGSEAAWAPHCRILAPRNLLALLNHFKGSQIIAAPEKSLQNDVMRQNLSLGDVKGQETAKRALVIAAAGGHNLLMIGPPGTGKSMLAARLSGLLPELSPYEALEISMIYSLAGQLRGGELMRYRPFRSPHHSASLPALVGGGHKALPGEISLAHTGVLFLDELPEFSRQTLESLRQPLENHQVTIARANAHLTYPARFQLIAAMNPCPCGYANDIRRPCHKRPKCALQYQSRLSGPLRDRFDLEVGVSEVPIHALRPQTTANASTDAQVKSSVLNARLMQKERYHNLESPPSKNTPLPNDFLNSTASHAHFEDKAQAETNALTYFQTAATQLHLSARSYYRCYRVARTIADLSSSPVIDRNHFSDALMLRNYGVSV
ncbi:MAG: YifB family Mg chelatase-like AAA ATPase [Caedimonadaceae bacterium]|nr:MAG: YifB family Mg chelatase-like AAA ATPase [Caedimonadaceae bacterium]